MVARFALFLEFNPLCVPIIDVYNEAFHQVGKDELLDEMGVKNGRETSS